VTNVTSDAIGPYELRGELGRGAMAVVWLGFDSRLERMVAIKEPMIAATTPDYAVADLSARFVREGRAAAQLNHPGIVTIHAADVFDGRPAIVMEYIEGETLASILDRGPLPPAAAVSILDQLLDAVAYAHDKGVVHRDIKPDNVFVTPDGRVKLADFGIAHVGSSATLTQAGTVMGTPGYMAPEQVTGGGVDGRADIFAIGAIAYEMLSGRNPFGATDGMAPTTVMYRIVHEEPPGLPAGALADLPVAMAPIIGTALSKDPADRFSDARAFRAALAGGPIVTGQGAGVRSPGQSVQQVWGSAAAAATVQPQGAATNWTPYLVVGGAGVLIIALLLAFSGGAPQGGSTLPGQTATATPPAVVPAAPGAASGPDLTASAQILTDNYSRIGGYGGKSGKSGKIAGVATRFNNEIGTGSVSDSTIAAAASLVSDIEAARDGLSSQNIDPSLEGVRQTQLKLYTYCLMRAQALVAGGEAQQSGSDPNPALLRGHNAKDAYDSAYPQGRP